MKKVNELNAEKILKKIEREKEKIRKTGAKKIGLFGSFVKGEQKKKSDIDFLVEFDKITFNNYFDLLFLLERLFKRKIDLIIEQDLRPELSYVLEETKYVKI